MLHIYTNAQVSGGGVSLTEIDINNAYSIMKVLKRIINTTDNDNNIKFIIFNRADVIRFIEESASNFIELYKDIYNSYK